MASKKHGIVFVLDALGAGAYSEAKIEDFLSARKKLIHILSQQAKELGGMAGKEGPIKQPVTYTFGDTLIVAIQLDNEEAFLQHIYGSLMLMQNYVFHSLEEGILFRGAFSIGCYFEDPDSNTVMGDAVSDAASWYDKAEWMGLSSTPKTNSVMEFYIAEKHLKDPKFITYYPVPIKGGRQINLYCVSWAGRFFMGDPKDPRKKFLGLLKDQAVPLGTELKYENTKQYFAYVEEAINSA